MKPSSINDSSSPRPTVKLWITDFWHPSTLDAIQKNPLYILLAGHFDIELTENPDFVIYSCFGNNHRKFDGVRIFYAGENVRPDFDECDYAFSFDFPETERNVRLPLYRLYAEYPQLLLPRRTQEVMSQKRKFCAFLNSNLRAQERIDFFDQLSAYRPVDGGGKVRNTIGYLVDDKMDFMRQYKFSIAFENSVSPGYTTEKLMHALVADTIPIYWGNPLAHRDFNSKAFINCHDYASFGDVVEVVKAIDQNDDLYQEYLSQPFFKDGIENQYVREDRIIAHFSRIFANPRSRSLSGFSSAFVKHVNPSLQAVNRRVAQTYRQFTSFLR